MFFDILDVVSIYREELLRDPYGLWGITKMGRQEVEYRMIDKKWNFYKRILVRMLSSEERSTALDLAWRVFSEYESPDYSEEGTEEFWKCRHDEEYLAGMEYYGAFDGESLIGLVGICTDRKHICFFFVDGEYHRQGIGTRLFKKVLEDYPNQTITLNSSPYGVPFYHALGFEDADKEQTVNGIRFTPMKYFENFQSMT